MTVDFGFFNNIIMVYTSPLAIADLAFPITFVFIFSITYVNKTIVIYFALIPLRRNE